MKNIIIIAIAAVVGIVGGGAGGYFLALKLNPAPVEVVEEVFDLKDGASLPLDTMTIKLKPSGGRSAVLKAKFVVVLKDEEALATAEKMKDYYYDAILSVIETKTAEDLGGFTSTTVTKPTEIVATADELANASENVENSEQTIEISKRNAIKEPILEAIRALYNNEEDREKIMSVMITDFSVN